MNAKEIAKKIIERFNIHSSEKLDSLIFDAIMNIDPNIGPLVRYELVEKMRPKVRRLIQKKIDFDENRGIPPFIKWSSIDDRRVIGRCFISRTSNEEDRQRIQKLRLLEDISIQLIELSSDDFEILCCVVMEFEGLSDINRTHPPDRRIDFFGYYREEPDPTQIWRVGDRKVIGQAKRWNSRVGEPVVDTLGHAIKHLERRESLLEGVLPDEFIAGDEIAWGVFAVSGEFTEKAWVPLTSPSERIIPRDGQHISLSILNNNIGCTQTNGNIIFNIEELRRYLRRREGDFPVFFAPTS